MAKILRLNFDKAKDTEEDPEIVFDATIFNTALMYMRSKENYDKHREEIAAGLNISPEMLDMLVKETIEKYGDRIKEYYRRKTGEDFDGDNPFQSDDFDFEDIEPVLTGTAKKIHYHKPWLKPVTSDEMAEVLNSMAEEANKYVQFPNPTDADMAVLWSACTFGFACNLWKLFPRLLISADDPEAGKTNLMEVIANVTYNGLLLDGATPASALFIIDKYHVTGLFDEGNNYLKDRYFRLAINSGFKEGGIITKMMQGGTEEKIFEVSSPMVLGGIRLWDVLEPDSQSRCLNIILAKKKVAIPHIKKLDIKKCGDLARKCARFVFDNTKTLQAYDLPRDGRTSDKWEPLFALANTVGNGWVERCVSAAENKTHVISRTSFEILLSYIRDVFLLYPTRDRIWQKTLGEKLYAFDDHSWTKSNSAKKMQKEMAEMLAKRGIRTKSIKITGTNNKGYMKEMFIELWKTHLKETEIEAKERLKKDVEIIEEKDGLGLEF